MISGTDFFEQSVTDNELEWLTWAYNLYTIKKDTFSQLLIELIKKEKIGKLQLRDNETGDKRYAGSYV